MKLWNWIKEPLSWLMAFVLLPVALIAGAVYALWKLSPFSKESGESQESPDYIKPRPDIVGDGIEEWKELNKIEKEKDHEKTLSELIDDHGGIVSGQPISIRRGGYFDNDGRYHPDGDN